MAYGRPRKMYKAVCADCGKEWKSRSNPQKGGRSTAGNAGRRGEEKEEDINVRFVIKPLYLIIQKRKSCGR